MCSSWEYIIYMNCFIFLIFNCNNCVVKVMIFIMLYFDIWNWFKMFFE